MGHNGDATRITWKDILILLDQAEAEHAVQVRVSVVPRPHSHYKQGGIVLVTPYNRQGRKMADVQPQQHLYPSTGHKTLEGLVVYLIHALLNEIGEAEARRAQELKQEDYERLTPLERYIAGDFQS